MTSCRFTFPPQIHIARLPTPLQPLRRFSEKLGVELFIKRDDLTGAALSGNKIRKLEFVLAEDVPQEKLVALRQCTEKIVVDKLNVAIKLSTYLVPSGNLAVSRVFTVSLRQPSP